MKQSERFGALAGRAAAVLSSAVLIPLFCAQCGSSGGTPGAPAPSESSHVQVSSQTEPSPQETASRIPTRIAAFYVDELNDTVEKALEAKTDDGFSCILISDMHIDYQNERMGVLRQLEAVIDIAEKVGLDCVILGGDIIHGTSSHDQSVRYLKDYAAILKRAGIPVLVTHGNHDDNGYHNSGNPGKTYSPWYVPISEVVSPDEWRESVQLPLAAGLDVHDANNPNSTYYYVDFEAKKVRVIVLDEYDYPYGTDDGFYADYVSEGWSKVSDGQIAWLIGQALDPNKEGWTYVLSSHGPLVMGSQSISNRKELLEVFTAFNNRTEYKNDRLGIAADFTGAKPVMPVQLCGHTHINVSDHDDGVRMQMIGVGSAKVSYYPDKTIESMAGDADYAAMPYRQAGDVSEATFDVIVLNRDGSLSRIAFGAGEDQQFDVSGYIK